VDPTRTAQKPGNGRLPPDRGEAPRAVEVASGGLRETQDFKDVCAAIAEDVLSGSLSHKVAGPVVRSVLAVVRIAEFEQRHANGASVPLADSRRPRGQGPDRDAALAAEEAALVEQLEAVRKERAAG
jgi:hypothetical protein